MGSNSSIVISFAIAILLLLILLLLLSYNTKCNKNDRVERFINDDNQLLSFDDRFNKKTSTNVSESFINDPYNPNGPMNINTSDNITPYEGNQLSEAFENNTEDPTTCFKRDRLTKDDLLPKDANLKWAEINPSSAGDITDKNFLTAGYHIGINTVGQSLRNANLQLRSELPNPQVAVSPWMISTIEPDVRPVSFEIGSSPSY